MQFGSKDWAGRDRSGQPERYTGPGRTSRSRSYEPNEARSGGGAESSSSRYEDPNRHGASWSTSRSHQWESNKEYDNRQRPYDYVHRSTYRPDPRTDQRTEHRADPRTDRRMDPRTEHRTDPRTEHRTDPVTERRSDIRTDNRPDPRIDHRAADPRIDHRADPRTDVRTDPRTDVRTDPRTDVRTDSRVEPRIEQRPDPRAHSTSRPYVSSEWNAESGSPNLTAGNQAARFTEDTFSDPGEDVPGSPDSHTRAYWNTQASYNRQIEQFDYKHERGFPSPTLLPSNEVHGMEVHRREDEHMQVPMPMPVPGPMGMHPPTSPQLQSPLSRPPGGVPHVPEPIDVLELANKISSLGPLIRDPRLLTRILKITKTDETLTSPKREDPNPGPARQYPHGAPTVNPNDLQWSKPSGNQEMLNQSSRQSKLSEYSQKYKIVKKSQPPPPPAPPQPPQTSKESANSSSGAVDNVGQNRSSEHKSDSGKDAKANAVSNGCTAGVLKGSNEKEKKQERPEKTSVPHFASKAQMLVKDSFIKRKQEGRAKMSTPAAKSDNKQNQALLKLVTSSKEDSGNGENTGSPSPSIPGANPMVKLPGLKNILNSVMKTSISQVLRNRIDSPKSSTKEGNKKPAKDSEKQSKISSASSDTKNTAKEAETKVKPVSEVVDESKDANKTEGVDVKDSSSRKDTDASKQAASKANRARKGQSPTEKTQNLSAQQAVVTRKQAALTSVSSKGKKKLKKRHFRGGTYSLYLSSKKKKKRGGKDNDELSVEGTETTGSLIDSEDDASLASEEMMSTSEKSFQDDDQTPLSGKYAESADGDEQTKRPKSPLEDLKRNLTFTETELDDKPTKETTKTKGKTAINCSVKVEPVSVSQEVTAETKREEARLKVDSPNSGAKTDGKDLDSDVTANSDIKIGSGVAAANKIRKSEELDQVEGDMKESSDGTERPPLSPENSETVCSSAESHTLSDNEINKENTPFLTPKQLHSIASSVKTRQRVRRRHGESDHELNSVEAQAMNGESPFKKPKRIQSSSLISNGIPPVPAHPVTNLAKIATSCFPKLDVMYDLKRLKHSACTCQARPVEARSCDTGKAKIYCQAVDSIDDKLIGCCNVVAKPQLVRPSTKIPFTAMCEVHLWRLRHHHCCPICGVFCSQGFFLQCLSSLKGKSQIHLFHKCCLVANEETDLCPHCGDSQCIKSVQLELNTPTAPTFYLSQKPLFSEPRAKMTITRLGSEEAACPEDLIANKYVIPDTEKVLSSAGLPMGPERSKLDKLLGEFNAKELDSSKCNLNHLRQAAKDGHLEKTLQLLAHGIDPNLKEDEIKDVPIHVASMNGHLAIVHLLVQAGASVDRLDDHLYTPLMLAVENYQTEIAQYLVKSGAHLLAKGEDGMTCLHLAARCGSVPICKILLDTGRITPNVQDDGGWTPVVWAAEHSHLDVVRLMVERGADPNMRDNEQNIALHWSAFSGNVDISHLFLELGSDLSATNEHGDTPLHIAARQNKYACVVLFLARGADIEVVNKENETPIMCCADSDSQTCMALLMNKELKTFAQNRTVKAEKVIHCDVSKGKEQNGIQCVNGVDDEKVPTDYMYVTENCETSTVNLDRTITSLQSCRCEDDCTSPNCTCATLSFKCWFDNEGRLLPEFNLSDPPMIFECNRACLCWKNCNNRALQHGILCRLQLFRTHNKGWGVRTLKDIPKGTFICEYIGEIITDGEADQREDDSYLFDLDNRQDGETYCLDARYYGNISRFVNHQCEPNLVPVKIFVDHQDLSFPRIAFFSSRVIYADEELGFDYGEKFWVIKYKSFTCDCGSPNCKYSKDTIHQTLENYYRRLKEEQQTEENIEGTQEVNSVPGGQ